jgi:hypothetical protein
MYTMKDFERDLFIKYFPKLTPQEQQEVLRTVPPEASLAGLSEEQIRQYLDQLTTTRKTPFPKTTPEEEIRVFN